MYTEKEILQQPRLWKRVYELVLSKKEEIIEFMEDLSLADSEVVLTGAGSSFFVAQILEGIFQQNTQLTTRAVSSTELVTHPHYYLNPQKETVLVSFARSGNSPESIAAVRNAEIVTDRIRHLIITCNAEGNLANLKTDRKRMVIVLPPEANDKSLAMTSSVTSMVLTLILISSIKQIQLLDGQIELLAKYTDSFFQKYTDKIKSISELNFDRAVFLGSGPMVGVAREAHLKLQELTDGKIISKFDSFLGFRHGPKAVVNSRTLVVYHLSNEPYVIQYERDLINSVREQNPLHSIVISEHFVDGLEVDLQIVATDDKQEYLDPDFLTLYSLVPAQYLALYKSLWFGLDPDSPSVSGAIHRVVQGVKIYPFKKLKTHQL